MARIVDYHCSDLSGWAVEDEYEAWRGLRGVLPEDCPQGYFMLFDYGMMGLPSPAQINLHDMLFPVDIGYLGMESSGDYEVLNVVEGIAPNVVVDVPDTILNAHNPYCGYVLMNSSNEYSMGVYWGMGDNIGINDFEFSEPGYPMPPSSILVPTPPTVIGVLMPWLMGIALLGMVGVITLDKLSSDGKDRRIADG